MWVIKFPDKQYYWGDMIVTPYLNKAKLYRSEPAVKGALQGVKLSRLQNQVGKGKPQYVQLVEA